MAASAPSTALLKRNLILQCFHALKENDRYVTEGSSRSNYEAFWDKLNIGFSLSVNKPFRPTNSSVEEFYRGTMHSDQFLFDVEENIIRRAQDKLDANLDPLLSISWDVYCSNNHRRKLCECLSRLCGRQIWAIYNKLDEQGTSSVDINDITQLILKFFYANGRSESPSNIREWFCDQPTIDFWSFFSALVENHFHLLQLPVVQSVYEEIVHEILKQGKMTKKGHKVQTWKERWFVLTSTHLYYYESLENRIQKGVITINQNTRVSHLPGGKGRSYLFQVVDGITNRGYEISASDPQMLKDWVEIIQVVVAAQREQGRNLMHRLFLARAKLFPEGNIVPAYSNPTSSTEYNEGMYRMVVPISRTSKESPRPGFPGSSPSSPSKEPAVPVSSSSPPPQTGQQSWEVMRPSQAPTEPPKKQGPTIAPYHKNSTGKIEHVTVDGHDYALVDKLLEERDSPPPPPVPKTRIPTDSNNPPLPVPKTRVLPDKEGSYLPTSSSIPPLPSKQRAPDEGTVINPPLPKPRDPSVPEKRSLSPMVSNPPVPRPRDTNTAPEKRPVGANPPLPKPRDTSASEKRPFSPVSTSPPVSKPWDIPRAQDEEENSSLPKLRENRLEVERPAPKPRNKLCATKSVPTPSITQDSHGGYALLQFNNTSTAREEAPKPRPQSNKPLATVKTKFAYSDVIVQDVPLITKDIDKALELKANKAPPAPPTKYEATSISKKNSLSDSSLPAFTHSETNPYRGHTYQNVHYDATAPSQEVGGNSSDEDDEGEQEPPPPPVPRRMESNRGNDGPVVPPYPVSRSSRNAPIPPPR